MLAKCDIYGHFNDTMQNLRSAWRVRKASVCKNASEWENWKLLDLTSILTNLYGSSWKILNRQKKVMHTWGNMECPEMPYFCNVLK